MEKKSLWIVKRKNDYGSQMRKMTLGHELRALNGKEMTKGYKLEKRL